MGGWAKFKVVGPDIKLLWASVFIRMASYGMTNQILTLFMKEVGIGEGAIGLFMTLTLAGDTVISFFLTVWSNVIGRRRIMVVGSVMMMVAGIVFSTSTNFYVLLVAAIVGVISPSGDETGPFKSVEEASLAHLVTMEMRPMVFAFHGLFSSAGGAIGSLICGFLVDHLHFQLKWDIIRCYRSIFVLYVLLACCKVLIAFSISRECEVEDKETIEVDENTGLLYANADNVRDSIEGGTSGSDEIPKIQAVSQEEAGGSGSADISASEEENDLDNRNQAKSYLGLSSHSVHYLSRLLVVFFLDSLGYGFMPSAWVVYYIRKAFNVPAKTPAILSFITNLVASVSSLPAAYFSSFLGPVAVMFCSQAPSSVCLMLVAFTNELYLAAFFLILYYSTSSMDVVPRQVLLSSIFSNEELAIVMGVVNIAKTFARCIGPIFTGQLSEHGKLKWGFVISGSCTLVASFILLTNFLKLDKKILSARRDKQTIH